MPQEVSVLTPEEEQAFQAWVKANKISDVDHPDSYYDYRGFWKASGGPAIKFGEDHFPDTYKQHGHPTFSVESQYSSGPSDGGRWEGESFVPSASRRLVSKALDAPEGNPRFRDSIQRAIEKELETNKPAPPPLSFDLAQGTQHQSLNPTVAAMLGAAGDAASTYNFLRQKGGAEDNTMFKGLRGPAQTAMGVAGSSIGSLLLARLLGKKVPALRDAYIANQGATSIGLAGENFSKPKYRSKSSVDSVNEKLAAEIGRK